MKKPLIILTGPTAVGKSALSVKLAKAINGEIISADSMQVYRGMDIGSAKIKEEEMDGVPHHLIDELDPKDPFHVVLFQQLANKYMSEIRERGRIPILTGGTGFYIQAVLYDIDFTENGEENEYRKKLEALAAERGAEYLHEQLREADPVSAEMIHANNIKRVIRALEYYHETGEPISKHNEEERKKESPYNFAYFVLDDLREEIYRRIDLRVDQMLRDGLPEEVMRLKQDGCSADMVSMQGLGYKEILDHLDGNCTLEEAVYRIKRDTRHFAKRQLTWFRRERDVIWIRKEQFGRNDDRILEEMRRILTEKKIIPEENTPVQPVGTVSGTPAD